MKKIVKRWGASLIILLNSEDVQVYNLKEGDVVDIELVKINGVRK